MRPVTLRPLVSLDLPGGDLIRLVLDNGVDNAYLSFMRLSGRTPATVTSRRRLIVRVERAVGCPLVEASETSFAEWNVARAREVEDDTRAGELAGLRAFYRWARIFGFRDDDPTRRIPSPRRKQRLPRPINEERLHLAISTAEPTRVRPMLVLAAFAGLRAMEIARVRVEDIQGSKLVVVGKGGRSRVVPIHPELAVELSRLASSGWLFPRRDGLPGPIEAHSVSHACNAHGASRSEALGVARDLYPMNKPSEDQVELRA